MADQFATYYQTQRDALLDRDSAQESFAFTNFANDALTFHYRLVARLLRVKQFQRELTRDESNVLNDAFESLQYVYSDADDD